MARQFFDGSSQGSNAGPSFATPHHLPNAEMVRMNGRAGLNFDEAWAKEQQFHKLAEDNMVHAAWAAEFGSSPQRSLSGPFMQHEMSVRPDCKPSFPGLSYTFIHAVADQQSHSHMSVGGMYGTSMPMGMYGMNMSSDMYQRNYGLPSDKSRGRGKGS
jgi:hypothetical protein